MPHKCIHCGKILAPGSREILEGCSNCHGKFFFYIKDEVSQRKNPPATLASSNIKTFETEAPEKQAHAGVSPEGQETFIEFDNVDKKKVEADVRSILGIEDEDKPVVLDVESVRVLSPGKFEIDIASLMNRKPIVFKLEEGKYVIDLSSLNVPEKDKNKK